MRGRERVRERERKSALRFAGDICPSQTFVDES
jgi:hypothetical protein